MIGVVFDTTLRICLIRFQLLYQLFGFWLLLYNEPMKFFTLIAAFTLAFLLSACDWEWENVATDSFVYELRGIWVSNDPSVYSGVLEIDYNRITISGYGENQTPKPGGDDTRRPFGDYIKGIALKGNSEEEVKTNGNIRGQIFIKDAGILQEGISYTYWYDNPPPDYKRIHLLRFTFGGRQETLQRTE